MVSKKNMPKGMFLKTTFLRQIDYSLFKNVLVLGPT